MLDSIALPGDLEWPDHIIGWAVGQDVQTAVSGALHVQEGVRQAGRPITLQSGNSGNTWWAVVDYSVARALHAMANAAGTHTLTIPTLDGPPESFLVRFDQSDPIRAQAVQHVMPPAPGDWWAITLKFIVVG